MLQAQRLIFFIAFFIDWFRIVPGTIGGENCQIFGKGEIRAGLSWGVRSMSIQTVLPIIIGTGPAGKQLTLNVKS